MNASNTFENEFLLHLFQNAAIAGIGDVTGLPAAAAAGDFYLRLCTDAVVVDDEIVGTECAYTGYVAKGIAVPRTASGWSITAFSNQASNAVEVLFGACTAGAETVKYLEVWKNNTGDTEADRIAWVQLTTNLAITAGVTPKFAAGAVVVSFD